MKAFATVTSLIMILLASQYLIIDLVTEDLVQENRALNTESQVSIALPAGAKVARYLDLGPSVLQDGEVAEVEGLFDDLMYEPTAHGIQSMVTDNGNACALLFSGEIHCFSMYNYGGDAYLGQNETYLSSSIYQMGHAPVEVESPAGTIWTAIFSTQGESVGSVCAVDSSDNISCWGSLDEGNNLLFSHIANSNPEPVHSIHVEQSFACAQFVSGNVGCWGSGRTSGRTSASTTYDYNTTVTPIEVPTGVTVDHLVVYPTGACMVGTNGEVYCWGERDGTVTPTNESYYSDHWSSSAVTELVEPVASDWAGDGACLLFENGSVGCLNFPVDSPQRGSQTTVTDREDLSMVDIPVGRTATSLKSFKTPTDKGSLLCAGLDNSSTVCWGNEFDNAASSWQSQPVPYYLEDLPSNTVDFSFGIGWSEFGTTVALDSTNTLWQKSIYSYGNAYYANRTHQFQSGPSVGPTTTPSGWIGVDFAGNNIVGTATTLGTHGLTLWVNSSTSSTAYDFEIEVVDPFIDVDPIYEYEIGRRISQSLNVDTLCDPTIGMECSMFFWPAAPEGIGIQTWSFPENPWEMMGPITYNPSVVGTADGNKVNTDYTVVVQQWSNTYGHHQSPYSGGDLDTDVITTLTHNLTLRPSSQSFERIAVASGFPYEANLESLLPFMATSESFELDGSISDFTLGITEEDRVFSSVRSFDSMTCAESPDGTSCFGHTYSMTDQSYSYPLLTPTSLGTAFPSTTLIRPIDVQHLVDADIEDMFPGIQSACWINTVDVLECAATTTAQSYALELFTDDQLVINGMNGMQPTEMWDGAQVELVSVTLQYGGSICSSFSNGSLACRVTPEGNTFLPSMTAGGERTHWFEDVNVTSMSGFGSNSDSFCFISGGSQTTTAGLYCSSSWGGDSRFTLSESPASREFNQYITPSGSNGTVVSLLGEFTNRCAQLENQSLYCFQYEFMSSDESRSSYGGRLPAVFTIPNMTTVIDGSGNCLLDDSGDAYCILIDTNYGEAEDVPFEGHYLSWIRELGELVYNVTGSGWGDTSYLEAYKMDFGGFVVDITQSGPNLFAVLDDGTLMAAGSQPYTMGIGNDMFSFGISNGPQDEPTAATEVATTVLGLNLAGTPPAGYGQSPVVRLWGNSSYGPQLESGSNLTWDGESGNVIPFVLDYVHAVEFESDYLELTAESEFSLNVEVYCTWCTSFSFSPELPSGWVFDAENGTLSGDSGSSGPAVEYTVTASASNGTDSTSVRIRVVELPTEPSLSGNSLASTTSASPLELLVGVEMETIQLVDAEGVTNHWSISPSLPVGLHIDETEGRIYGTPAFAGDGPVKYTINATSPLGTYAEVDFWLSIVDEISEPVDTDGDGTPDASDDDDDNDGVPDAEDAFPLDASESGDLDGDGIGNNADTDADGDGVDVSEDLDDLDPSVGAPTADDLDGDGIPDADDDDMDGDGVDNGADAFPADSSETVDTDGDGVGNNADTDDDDDGVEDSNDAFPLDASESADLDGDGIGDNADGDADGDGVPSSEDQDDFDASIGRTSEGNQTQVDDMDGDGIADDVDDDIDGDGVLNAEDLFPADATESKDLDGDGIGDNADDDADGDGVPASEDQDDLDASVGRLSSEQESSSSSTWLVFVVLALVAGGLLFARRSASDDEMNEYMDSVHTNAVEEE